MNSVWLRRFRLWWHRTFPCHTEYWTNGGPISVPCDAYWKAHERELEEIRKRNEEARRLVTRPDFV